MDQRAAVSFRPSGRLARTHCRSRAFARAHAPSPCVPAHDSSCVCVWKHHICTKHSAANETPLAAAFQELVRPIPQRHPPNEVPLCNPVLQKRSLDGLKLDISQLILPPLNCRSIDQKNNTCRLRRLGSVLSFGCKSCK